MSMQRIVIVGGGAGGLELATALGKKLGRKGHAEITLVDRKTTHLWKPLLHEVATGSLDAGVDALSYRAHAANHGFEFQLGTMCGIDRDKKLIELAPILDDRGELVVESRQLPYDRLVLALGSVSNDFGTPGVSEHCIFLDAPEQANRFHRKLLDAYLRNSAKETESELNIAIVGGGATGVELSAELHKAAEELHSYGCPQAGRSRLNVTLVEAGASILPALPERITSSVHYELQQLGVDVRTGTMITEANSEGLVTREGKQIHADLMVWAAGIKAPDFLKDLGGLQTNRINQLVVGPTLQTTIDDDIFALGDCAECKQPDGSKVPPRAQAAHQMAILVSRNLMALMQSRPLKAYVYKDHGSLVSLSKYSTVGSLMGNLTRGSMKVEGFLARVVYISLYRMHQIALHGLVKTGLMMVVGRINRALRPTLKLH
uniref:NADH dehydrogenase n=1 Tax=Candidatus Kentrum sp. FM TaxID=2126340 RepID=A0A450S5P1_9GAMM|nr:MAG: NADH dehydrogenase [Candidatus Kentron sp. FM]VFJ65876.1 MAG: NADH dehydrogenase [Candidatus Kentron sp. FM]VFK15950.1 MAG: NADH dehydrogenase [Candidatus Kentron sp. FM]